MKAKLVIVLMFAVIIVAIAYFANRDPMNEQPEEHVLPKDEAQFETDRMKEELVLTQVQADSVKAINLKIDQEIDNFEKQKGNKEGHHSVIRKLDKQKEADFARILSPEQLKIYQENRKAERRRHLSEKMENAPSPEKFAKEETEQMKEEFNLSAKQTEMVSAVNLKYANKIDVLIHQEINKDEDNHDQIKVLEQQKTEEFSKILTADQLKQYTERKMKHHFGPKPMPKDKPEGDFPPDREMKPEHGPQPSS
jgi:hypothetical protein